MVMACAPVLPVAALAGCCFICSVVTPRLYAASKGDPCREDC